MIISAHIMLQSADEAADKAFFADVLKLNSVDAGQGFLIFAIPPAEIAVHGSGRNDIHQLFLMSDDIEAFAAEMAARGIAVAPRRAQGWGTLTEITLPGGGKLGVYEPHHARPKQAKAAAARKKRTGRPAARKAAKKKAVKKKATKAKPHARAVKAKSRKKARDRR
jgi:hypothetical protein